MIQSCTHPGCTALCFGPVCINHEPNQQPLTIVRGRPWPPHTLPPASYQVHTPAPSLTPA